MKATTNEKSAHIVRATAGRGGEAWLIDGGSRTAVYDTGMAYCAPELIGNLLDLLGGRPLSAVLLSHTHYDHAGGLPYLVRRWPNLIVYGSAYGQKVFQKSGALAAIRRMSDNAAQTYLGADAPPLDYRDDELRIDRVVGDGDEIPLGDRTIRVYETKGHTNCSLNYYVVEDDLMFTSESTGYLTGDDQMRAPFLSSYRDAIQSIEKCRALAPGWIIPPHRASAIAGSDAYWDLAKRAAEEQKDFVLEGFRQGLDDEAILKNSEARFWTGEKRADQPIEAFRVNMRAKIERLKKEFPE